MKNRMIHSIISGTVIGIAVISIFYNNANLSLAKEEAIKKADIAYETQTQKSLLYNKNLSDFYSDSAAIDIALNEIITERNTNIILNDNEEETLSEEVITVSDNSIPEDIIEEDTNETIEETDEDEKELLYRLVQAEAGNQSSLGKRLVTDCVLNMVDSDKYPDTITGVIYSGAFDVTKNGSINTVVPTESTKRCVDMELESRIDYEVMYFRAGHYHNFGVPYEQVGAHYFSKGSDNMSLEE